MTNMHTTDCPKCGGSGFVLDEKATGREMRKAREVAQLSLREVARRLDFSPAHISDLELGNRAWSPEKRKQYLDALKPKRNAKGDAR